MPKTAIGDGVCCWTTTPPNDQHTTPTIMATVGQTALKSAIPAVQLAPICDQPIPPSSLNKIRLGAFTLFTFTCRPALETAVWDGVRCWTTTLPKYQPTTPTNMATVGQPALESAIPAVQLAPICDQQIPPSSINKIQLGTFTLFKFTCRTALETAI